MAVTGILSSNSALFDYVAQGLQSRAQQSRLDFAQLEEDGADGTSSSRLQFAARQSNQQLDSVADAESQLAKNPVPSAPGVQVSDTAAPQADFASAEQDYQNRAEAQAARIEYQPGGLVSESVSKPDETLQSNSLSNAQRAYLSLQQEFQEFNSNNLTLLKAAIGNFSASGLSLTA